MRPPSEASLPAWPLRVFRPWVVACLGGIFIGASLLQIKPREELNSYLEQPPRGAAVSEFGVPGHLETWPNINPTFPDPAEAPVILNRANTPVPVDPVSAASPLPAPATVDGP